MVRPFVVQDRDRDPLESLALGLTQGVTGGLQNKWQNEQQNLAYAARQQAAQKQRARQRTLAALNEDLPTDAKVKSAMQRGLIGTEEAQFYQNNIRTQEEPENPFMRGIAQRVKAVDQAVQKGWIPQQEASRFKKAAVYGAFGQEPDERKQPDIKEMQIAVQQPDGDMQNMTVSVRKTEDGGYEALKPGDVGLKAPTQKAKPTEEVSQVDELTLDTYEDRLDHLRDLKLRLRREISLGAKDVVGRSQPLNPKREKQLKTRLSAVEEEIQKYEKKSASVYSKHEDGPSPGPWNALGSSTRETIINEAKQGHKPSIRYLRSQGQWRRIEQGAGPSGQGESGVAPTDDTGGGKTEAEVPEIDLGNVPDEVLRQVRQEVAPNKAPEDLTGEELDDIYELIRKRAEEEEEDTSSWFRLPMGTLGL